MGNRKLTFKSSYDALDAALAAFYDHNDIDLCRDCLTFYFDNIGGGEYEPMGSDKFRAAAAWFEIMVKTGLADSPEGSAARYFYLAVSQCVVDHAPPELEAMIDEGLREIFGLESSGYTDDGEPVYDAKAVRDVLGISEEEALKHLEGRDIVPKGKVNRIQ